MRLVAGKLGWVGREGQARVCWEPYRWGIVLCLINSIVRNVHQLDLDASASAALFDQLRFFWCASSSGQLRGKDSSHKRLPR